MGTLGNVKSPLDLSEEEWNNVLKTNLTGAWLVSKYVCIRMRDAERGGAIINISSIAGINRGQVSGAVAYASSKAGLNAFTKVTSFDFQFLIIVWNKNGYLLGPGSKKLGLKERRKTSPLELAFCNSRRLFWYCRLRSFLLPPR